MKPLEVAPPVMTPWSLGMEMKAAVGRILSPKANRLS